jgi:hypothetical protein
MIVGGVEVEGSDVESVGVVEGIGAVGGVTGGVVVVVTVVVVTLVVSTLGAVGSSLSA